MFQLFYPAFWVLAHAVPCVRTTARSYVLGCSLLVLQLLGQHINSAEPSRNALSPEQPALTAMVANTELLSTARAEAALMPEIGFQGGICCFLADECLALIYYSSVEMAENVSLIETVVRGFEKSTVILVEWVQKS